MVYIITEDSNSARDFWEIVAETFLGKGNYILEPLTEHSGGNTTLKSQVNSVFEKIRAGDTLFIAFDNVGNTKTFYTSDFLSRTQSRCNIHGVKFRYTTYYCFEELFLSYDELVQLCFRSKSADIIQYVHKCINNAEDYYMAEPVINYMNKHKENISNREHLLEHLLIEAGQSIFGYFKILKAGKSLYNKGNVGCKIVQTFKKIV